MDIQKLVDQKALIELSIESPEFKDLPTSLQIEVRHFHHIVSTVLDDLEHKVQQLDTRYDSLRHQLYGSSVKSALSLRLSPEPASSEDGTAK